MDIAVAGGLVASALVVLGGTILVMICIGTIEKNRLLYGIASFLLIISAIILGNHLFSDTIADIKKDYTNDVATVSNADEVANSL